MVLSGLLQSLLYEVQVHLRRGDAAFRFLLKDMKHVYHARQLHRIDGSVRIAVVVFNYLQDAGPAKAFQRLGVSVSVTGLSEIQGEANIAPHRGRECP